MMHPNLLEKQLQKSHTPDDMLTGRSVTGILHLCNQTQIDWYSKRKSTVETATFGSEFMAARIAVDQIIDLGTTLWYLGVPVNHKSYMFGDNQVVIMNEQLNSACITEQKTQRIVLSSSQRNDCC
jgi:hypothetical protein